jgi:hypothetical protein
MGAQTSTTKAIGGVNGDSGAPGMNGAIVPQLNQNVAATLAGVNSPSSAVAVPAAAATAYQAYILPALLIAGATLLAAFIER